MTVPFFLVLRKDQVDHVRMYVLLFRIQRRERLRAKKGRARNKRMRASAMQPPNPVNERRPKGPSSLLLPFIPPPPPPPPPGVILPTSSPLTWSPRRPCSSRPSSSAPLLRQRPSSPRRSARPRLLQRHRPEWARPSFWRQRRCSCAARPACSSGAQSKRL